MRRRGWVLVLVAVLCALVPVAAHAAAAPLSLRGTNWVLRGSASVNAVFDGGRVQGENACNAYRAPYTASGARLRIGPDVATTKVACPDADPDYEARLVQVASFRIRGTTLTLRDRAGRRLLSYRASIGKSALHGGWNATSYYTGSAVQSVEPGSTLTLEFADARVSGDGGCNTFDGGYRVQGVDRIHIGPLAATLRACADPALNDQETRYLAALQLAVRYRVTGRSLTLYRPGGTIAATFERATGLTSGS
jgi:heat shock protein HslJ